MALMTAREFTAKMEEAIVKVVSGEEQEIRFSAGMMLSMVDHDEAQKLTPAYMRTTLNRVPEVKATGKVSIKTTTDDDGTKFFVVTVNKNPRKKQLTTDDLEVIERKTREKFAKRLLGFMPNVMHLEGDKRDGAIEGIALYQDMIKKMAEGE
jgi:hypothetical protein